MTEVLGLISWWLEWLFEDFNTIVFALAPQQNWLGFTAHDCEYVFLFACFFGFFYVYITTSLCNCLLKVSVDDILSQAYNNAYIYRHTHILTCIHTKVHKVLLTIYNSCRLVIWSYHKSYQQCFDILLNYKKLEKFVAVKNFKKISKWSL